MNPLSILYVESTKAMGGQELATLRYARGLKARGHRVIVVVQPDSPMVGPARDTGLTLEPVRMSKSNPVKAVRDLVGLIHRYGIDIVQSNSSLDNWLLSVAVRIAKRRPGFIRIRHISAPLKKSFFTRLLYTRLVDRVVVTGGEIVRKGLIERDGLNSSKVHGIPIGYDQTLFQPKPAFSDLRDELKLPRSHRLVGIIAYLRHYKGHRNLIHAASRVVRESKEVGFVIVGEGPEEANLRSLIRELGLSDYVHLLGFREDLLDVYQSLNIFVHPSTEGDTLPQSILQAMAMGKPVIATPVGSIAEAVVDGASGYIVPVDDSSALAEKISALLDHQEMMKKMGEQGRKIAARYTNEEGLNRFEVLYADLLGV